MPDNPLQSSADRLLRLIKRRADWHLIESAAAILDDALALSRRGRGRPPKANHAAIREAAETMTVSEMVASGLGSETTIRRILSTAPPRKPAV